MATVHEKIMAMLATVQEMRKNVAKVKKPDEIVRAVADNSPIAQKVLIGMFPDISSRTFRRRLDALVQAGVIMRRKEGKEVFYLAYPQK